MTKLYIWIIDTDFFSKPDTLFIWALAADLETARTNAILKTSESTYPLRFKQAVQKILRTESPMQHHDGEIGMF